MSAPLALCFTVQIGSIWLSFLFGHAWPLCPLFFSRSLFPHAAHILSSSSSVLLFCSHSVCSSLPWGSFYLILRSSVAAVTPGRPNQISVSCVCRGAEARIEKEIAREVAWGNKQYLRQCADRKAQVRKAFVTLIELKKPEENRKIWKDRQKQSVENNQNIEKSGKKGGGGNQFMALPAGNYRGRSGSRVDILRRALFSCWATASCLPWWFRASPQGTRCTSLGYSGMLLLSSEQTT